MIRVFLVLSIICASTGAQGPLDGGENGAVFRGPGFAFGLWPHWTVQLDNESGDRGTARSPSGDATIRFEPYPLERGGRANAADFEKHIRAALAAGLPVGSLPLIPTTSHEGLVPCGDEPEGITLLFTKPGTDGEEPRRYFVHAYPRLDGRLQTLIGSHTGPAEHGISLALMHVADELAATWPDTGGTFRDATSGVVLPLPRGWRRCTLFPECGNTYMNLTEEDMRQRFMPRGVFAPIDHAAKIPGYESRPRVELSVIQDLNRSLGSVMDSQGEAGANAQEFVFADGAEGRISDSEHFITIVRREGRRFAKLRVLNPRAEDRDVVRELAKGLSFGPVSNPEPPLGHPKLFTAQGVAMSYPGDWTLCPHFSAPLAHPGVLAGGFEPIVKSERGRAGQERPELWFELARLDDLQAEHRRVVQWRPNNTERVKSTVEHEDHAFATDSGWIGWQWVEACHFERPRSRTEMRHVEYVLPMPDGVLALCVVGTTSDGPGNRGTGAALEEIWRKIVASARLTQSPPAGAKVHQAAQ